MAEIDAEMTVSSPATIKSEIMDLQNRGLVKERKNTWDFEKQPLPNPMNTSATLPKYRMSLNTPTTHLNNNFNTISSDKPTATTTTITTTIERSASSIIMPVLEDNHEFHRPPAQQHSLTISAAQRPPSSSTRSSSRISSSQSESEIKPLSVITIPVMGGVINIDDLISAQPSDPDYKMQRAAVEIYTTEMKYVQQLAKLKELAEKLKNKSYSFNLFRDIGSLHLFHEELLKDMRQVCVENRDYIKMYKPLSSKKCQYLNMYKDIAHWISQERQQYCDEKQRDPALDRIVKETIRCNDGKDDLALLNDIPMRITRYEILLNSLIKYIPDDTEDKAEALLAVQSIGKIVRSTDTFLDTATKQAQKLEVLAVELNSVKKEPAAWAVFIKRGFVKKISRRNESRCDTRELFLFSDMLYVKADNQVKMELPIITFDLGDISITDSYLNQLYAHRFRVSAKEGCIDLLFDSEEDKKQWYETIKAAVLDIRSRRKTDAPIGTSAPVWDKDQSVSMCQCCNTSFTLFIRRHHCRQCGKVICSDCSRFSPANKSRESRRCKYCHGNRMSLPVLAQDDPNKHVLTMFLSYDKYDSGSWQKVGKFYCRISLNGTLMLYKKPRDTVPQLKVVCVRHTVTESSRSSGGNGPDDCVFEIQHPKEPIIHRLKILDLEKKTEFYNELCQRIGFFSPSS